MKEYTICKYCVMESGIKGFELQEKHLETAEDLMEHIEREHHIAVRMKNETEEECLERFYKQYPEAGDPETCKCPDCKSKRRSQEMLNSMIN